MWCSGYRALIRETRRQGDGVSMTKDETRREGDKRWIEMGGERKKIERSKDS